MRFFESKTRLIRFSSTVSWWWEPRDLWFGYFHGPDASFLVLIPCFPLRFEGKRRAAARAREAALDTYWTDRGLPRSDPGSNP